MDRGIQDDMICSLALSTAFACWRRSQFTFVKKKNRKKKTYSRSQSVKFDSQGSAQKKSWASCNDVGINSQSWNFSIPCSMLGPSKVLHSRVPFWSNFLIWRNLTLKLMILNRRKFSSIFLTAKLIQEILYLTKAKANIRKLTK